MHLMFNNQGSLTFVMLYLKVDVHIIIKEFLTSSKSVPVEP